MRKQPLAYVIRESGRPLKTKRLVRLLSAMVVRQLQGEAARRQVLTRRRPLQ